MPWEFSLERVWVSRQDTSGLRKLLIQIIYISAIISFYSTPGFSVRLYSVKLQQPIYPGRLENFELKDEMEH